MAFMALKNVFIITLVIIAQFSVIRGQLQCRLDQYHYEYTECDSTGGRWRVSVPKEPGLCQPGSNTQVLPVRGKDCNFVCNTGEYLDIQGDQECHPCPEGTYSLGGGIRFDDWETLPMDFTVQTEKVSESRWGYKVKTSRNCTRSAWQPSGRYIMSVPSQCPSKLIFSAKLVRPGKVSFEYQYTDPETIFHFVVQNDQCQALDSDKNDKWPEVTEEGTWKTFSVNLKTGMNVLEWRTIGALSEMVHGTTSPVLIRKIEIKGVAFTSECTKCINGTYSSGGSSFCQMCPPNTYSEHGASQCLPCADTEYSEPGSAKCLPRPACTEYDYYAFQKPCDDNGQTQITHQWITPKICSESSPDSVLLPLDGALEDCPPCNPGMRQVNMSSCGFCEENHYADDQGVCRQCRVSTAPNYEINYKYWNTLPPNITSNCLSVGVDSCSDSAGWVPMGDHLTTVVSPNDRNVFLLLSLKLDGIRGEPGIIDGKPSVLATISFEAELKCNSACQLIFLSDNTGRNSVLKTFEDNVDRTMVSQKIYMNGSQEFTWAFQPDDYGTPVPQVQDLHLQNHAKIYNIRVTNTQSGAATMCQSCPEGKTADGCIPCADGEFVDPDTQRCRACPPGTVLPSSNSWGKDSCKPCGHGLHPIGGRSCKSDCHFVDDMGRDYDFTELDGLHFVTGARLFTASGTQYYHGFNISLCNHGNAPLPSCVNNVTADALYSHKSEESEFLAKNSLLNQPAELSSMICRSTLVPQNDIDKPIVSTQPVSLGSHLTKILTNISLQSRYEEEGFSTEDSDRDIHFYYESGGSSTGACPEGRSTIISLHCDPKEKGTGRIQLPPKCSDGTCDGCNFHFLWHTVHACPHCRKEDYKVVKGECIQGEQDIHYFPPEHCLQLPENQLSPMSQKCTVLPFAVMVAIPVCLGVGLILILVLIYCWSRNKKLEYKYMKLVETAGGHDGELPAADTCGMDDDEEDVHFADARGEGSSFFSKIKDKFSGNRMKGDEDNPFVAVKMSEKMSLT